jgi:hypothetical protein
VILVDIFNPLIPDLVERLKASALDFQIAVFATMIFMAFLPAVRA